MNANQDGILNMADAICLLGHLFLADPVRLPCIGGTVEDPGNRVLLDFNGDAAGVDISDGVAMLEFLFTGGPRHILGSDCARIAACPEHCAVGR
jgi:hypothetical protein